MTVVYYFPIAFQSSDYRIIYLVKLYYYHMAFGQNPSSLKIEKNRAVYQMCARVTTKAKINGSFSPINTSPQDSK